MHVVMHADLQYIDNCFIVLASAMLHLNEIRLSFKLHQYEHYCLLAETDSNLIYLFTETTNMNSTLIRIIADILLCFFLME